jgi:hypothetical protein
MRFLPHYHQFKPTFTIDSLISLASTVQFGLISRSVASGKPWIPSLRPPILQSGLDLAISSCDAPTKLCQCTPEKRSNHLSKRWLQARLHTCLLRFSLVSYSAPELLCCSSRRHGLPTIDHSLGAPETTARKLLGAHMRPVHPQELLKCLRTVVERCKP